MRPACARKAAAVRIRTRRRCVRLSGGATLGEPIRRIERQEIPMTNTEVPPTSACCCWVPHVHKSDRSQRGPRAARDPAAGPHHYDTGYDTGATSPTLCDCAVTYALRERLSP